MAAQVALLLASGLWGYIRLLYGLTLYYRSGVFGAPVLDLSPLLPCFSIVDVVL